MHYIKRHLEEVVLQTSKSFSAILVTGPRQAGKTTMLRTLAETENRGRKYVSLDDLDTRAMAKNDPKMFLQLHQPPVLIDEVQYAPELFTYIKIHIDEHHNPGDFWMTGSQIFRLMRGVQESLAGRVALLHMSPMSQREIAGRDNQPFKVDFDTLLAESKTISADTTPELYSKLWNGSMPGIVSGEYQNRSLYYSSYLSTYLERDVRELSDTIDALKFMAFITSTAARTGQILNFKAIADDVEINQVTAKNWINILETLGIIFLLYPYSNNVLKRTIKAPKLYFYDLGLVCYLTKWSDPEVAMNGAMSGALLENYAISEILKTYQNAGKRQPLHYYRDRDAKEIDLLLEGDGQLYPVEIKKAVSPSKHVTRVFNVIDKSPLQRGPGAILCMAEQFGAFDRNNLIVPIWMI
ncbi:ATP-binding protein [Christensenella minuta]|uniref:ATP-binding protein n=1 Tax=Christensenella minuta TaxID=626937 RepID=UPI00215732AD|nr:ATP-binding protein [Christensenella minuta]